MTPQNKQHPLALLLALGAVMLLASSVAVFSQRQIRLRGALDGLPDPQLTHRPPILGVNVELTQYDTGVLNENLDLIKQTGFIWLRQIFAWNEIEKEPGVYDWSEYDLIVKEARARHLRLVAVLWRSPEWAADSPTAPPENPERFGLFAGELAQRYGTQIDVYQIWDEPNLMNGWGGQPTDPVGYTRLLEAAYRAIHANDPTALVLIGGLAPTIETGPDNLSDVQYLRSLYENGADRYFDGVAGKPYGFDTGPEDRRVDINLLNFSRFLLLREEMVRYGDGHKPLWATQFGWNTLPKEWKGGASIWGLTTPTEQARWILGSYERALTEWPWSGALIIEGWQPAVSETDPRWGFALRDEKGELSLAARALEQRSELFNSALWPGVYPATTPLAEYRGQWEFDTLQADIVENGNSQVSVPFAGDSLGVVARRDDYRAYLYVTVDGHPSNVLPQDTQGTYAVLTSPDYTTRVEPILVADALEPLERHTAVLRAERGWDQWAIVGFVVGSDVDTTLYDILALSLLVMASIAGAASIRVGKRASAGAGLSDLGRMIRTRLSATAHLMLALAAALAMWIGAALTWGGVVPNLMRRAGDGPSLLLTLLTAGLFYYSAPLVLTIIALIILFVLIYARPDIGLALIMFFTPYYLLPRPLFDRMFSMVEVTSLLTLLAWGIHLIAERKEEGWPSLGDVYRRMTSLDKAVALSICIAIVSLSWSELIGVAVTELRQMVLEPVVMFLVLRTMPFTREERWRIVDLLILTGVIVSLIGLYQLATKTDLVIAEEGAVRVRSVFGTPNNLGLYLERLIPITAAVVLVGRSKLRRSLYGSAGTLMLVVAVLAKSKGSLLLGLPAGVGMVFILWAGRAGLIAIGIGLALELLALIPLSQHPRFRKLFDLSSGESTSFFRIQLYQSALHMIRDHPITGLGLDQFLYQYRGRYIQPSAWQQPDLSQPHNLVLNYWIRLGIIGLIAGIWLQVAFWQLSWRTQQALRATDSATRALVVGLMGSMAAFLAHGMVDEVHFVIDLAFIFFMSLGLMHQIGRESGVLSNGGDRHGGQSQQPNSQAG